MDLVHFGKFQHGHQLDHCPQGARLNGRMKIIFEFFKSFWWVANIYSEKHFGGGGGPNEVELQNLILHMILILIQSPHFACLPFEIGDDFGVVVLGKVEVLDVVLDEVKRVDKV